jgi:hypothetical protein
MMKNCGHKMKLKRGDLKTKVKAVTVWKDKQPVNILMHMHSPPSQGNFCDEHRKVVKPATVQNYA